MSTVPAPSLLPQTLHLCLFVIGALEILIWDDDDADSYDDAC